MERDDETTIPITTQPKTSSMICASRRLWRGLLRAYPATVTPVSHLPCRQTI